MNRAKHQEPLVIQITPVNVRYIRNERGECRVQIAFRISVVPLKVADPERYGRRLLIHRHFAGWCGVN